MDFLQILAIGLGLYNLIGNILPNYYDSKSGSPAPLPSYISAFSDWDKAEDLKKFQQEKNSGQIYDFIVGKMHNFSTNNFFPKNLHV